MNRPINWWNIITRLSRDKSTWDYLEPAEIVEILQRIIEAKDKITGLEKYVKIYLSPALQKLSALTYSWHFSNMRYNLKYVVQK